MTKIGLVSDSHGNLENLKRAITNMGKVDLIVHTGDYIEDGEEIKHWTNIPVMCVKGNMDRFIKDKPEFIRTKIDGHNVYIVHGHQQRVKSGIDHIAQEARAHGCDLVFFGHTHKRAYAKGDNLTIINPGSCSLPSDGLKSYAIVTIDGDDIDCQFYEVPNE